jgi:hypothetical protein
MSVRLIGRATPTLLALGFAIILYEPLNGVRDQHQALVELEQH